MFIYSINIFQSYLKEIENEKENLIASNNSMAEFNLSKEPELVEGREKIQELSEIGEELTKSVEEKTKILSKSINFMAFGPKRFFKTKYCYHKFQILIKK